MPRKFKTEEAKRKNYDYHNNYTNEKYKRIIIQLKLRDDAELINWMDGETASGHSYSDLAKTALRRYYEKSK